MQNLFGDNLNHILFNNLDAIILSVILVLALIIISIIVISIVVIKFHCDLVLRTE